MVVLLLDSEHAAPVWHADPDPRCSLVYARAPVPLGLQRAFLAALQRELFPAGAVRAATDARRSAKRSCRSGNSGAFRAASPLQPFIGKT